MCSAKCVPVCGEANLQKENGAQQDTGKIERKCWKNFEAWRGQAKTEELYLEIEMLSTVFTRREITTKRGIQVDPNLFTMPPYM